MKSTMTRIQFDLSKKSVKEFETLMKDINVRTKKDLLNNALALLKWAVKEVKDGKIIASMDEQKHKYKELCMPALSAVKL